MPVPVVGSSAPPLDGVDVHGQPVSQASLNGSQGLVLVFFRGAW